MAATKGPELVEVGLPVETLRAAGIPEGEARTEVNRRLVLELYREGRVSLGRAAELAAMTTSAFLDFMEQHRTYLNYGEEELEQDRATAGPPAS